MHASFVVVGLSFYFSCLAVYEMYLLLGVGRKTATHGCGVCYNCDLPAVCKRTVRKKTLFRMEGLKYNARNQLYNTQTGVKLEGHGSTGVFKICGQDGGAECVLLRATDSCCRRFFCRRPRHRSTGPGQYGLPGTGTGRSGHPKCRFRDAGCCRCRTR